MIHSGAPGITALAVWEVRHLLKYKDPSILSQLDPVTDTWYPILDTTLMASLDYIVFNHNYGEARKFAVKITIDGQEITCDQIDVTPGAANFVSTTASYGGGKSLEITTPAKTIVDVEGPLEGQSVKVEIRTRENIDGGKGLWAAVYYHARD